MPAEDTRWERTLKDEIKTGERFQIVIQQVQGQKYHIYEEITLQEQGEKWLRSDSSSFTSKRM